MNAFFKQTLTILLLTFFSTMSYAIDLDEARKSEKVVELPTGYLEAKDASTKAFVDDINAKRKKAYEDVAEKTKTSPDVVGARAHQKIMNDLKNK